MNMDIKNNQIPVASVTPVFDYQEITPTKQTNKATPPEFKPSISESDKKSAQTTLPGSNSKTENITTEGIKSTVGEIVQNLDRDNAWSNIANNFKSKLSQQAKLDDEEALQDPVNIAWSISAGAEIAQFATA